jgi:hypothetical protein
MSTLWDALRKKDTATVKRLIDAKVVDVNEAGAVSQRARTHSPNHSS